VSARCVRRPASGTRAVFFLAKRKNEGREDKRQTLAQTSVLPRRRPRERIERQAHQKKRPQRQTPSRKKTHTQHRTPCRKASPPWRRSGCSSAPGRLARCVGLFLSFCCVRACKKQRRRPFSAPADLAWRSNACTPYAAGAVPYPSRPEPCARCEGGDRSCCDGDETRDLPSSSSGFRIAVFLPRKQSPHSRAITTPTHPNTHHRTAGPRTTLPARVQPRPTPAAGGRRPAKRAAAPAAARRRAGATTSAGHGALFGLARAWMGGV
jgi:hypothetical protein